HMSSGLRIRAPQDPDYDPTGPSPAHVYLYTGGIDSFHYAATRPLQWPPNTVGRYHNTDPVLISYLTRLGVEKNGDEYLSFPQRRLFDKLGIRTMVIETDPFGNFLGQGYEVGSGRDWARLGNLFLQGGVWNGERILPEGYTTFVSTLAPACPLSMEFETIEYVTHRGSLVPAAPSCCHPGPRSRRSWRSPCARGRAGVRILRPRHQ